MKTTLQLYFLLLFGDILSAEPCFKPKKLNLFKLGASCDGTPSLRNLQCGRAIDGNPNTLWHPASQTQQKYFLSLNQKGKPRS
jgi:hypothetical protein